jgi:hypothetical protein
LAVVVMEEPFRAITAAIARFLVWLPLRAEAVAARTEAQVPMGAVAEAVVLTALEALELAVKVIMAVEL